MGTYGGKERATANHRSSERRRNSQNRAWHRGKQHHLRSNQTSHLQHYWHNVRPLLQTAHVKQNWTIYGKEMEKQKKTWCNSLYIFTLPHKSFNTLQKYYSLPFRRTHLLQSLQMPHGSETLYILLNTKCRMFRKICTSHSILNSELLQIVWLLYADSRQSIKLLNLCKQMLPCCGSTCISLHINISSKMMKYG